MAPASTSASGSSTRSVRRGGSQSQESNARSASRHLAGGVLRALAAAVAGVVLACGIGVLVWAVTPSSGSPGTVLRGAIAALGAANFLPPSIGGITITAPPLLLTAVCFGTVASAANAGRRPGVTLPAELSGAVLVGLIYGAVVTAVVSSLAPAGAENVGRGWAPVLLGIVAAISGVLLRGRLSRDRWRALAPAWLQVGLRSGGAGLLLILAGGGIGVVAGLALSFGTAIDLSSITAPSVGDGVGMVLLGLSYLPNAVIAGAGYSTGTGFQIGAGTYSPLGTTGIDLPGLPLLAAVPASGGLSPIGLLLAVFPLAAAAVIGLVAVRGLLVRRDRVLAALTAAAVAGVGTTVLAAVAGGGVQGSPWAHFGVPLWVGLVVFGGLAAIGGTIAAVAGWSSVPRTVAPAPQTVSDSDPAVDPGLMVDPDPVADPGDPEKGPPAAENDPTEPRSPLLASPFQDSHQPDAADEWAAERQQDHPPVESKVGPSVETWAAQHVEAETTGHPDPVVEPSADTEAVPDLDAQPGVAADGAAPHLAPEPDPPADDATAPH
ncbi:MAG: DUF6350 family protein [Actinomycetota bacterium]|nr:DUF6350 family protein [Actinomycetota bacterium]